jgi:hypothetical protein
MSKNSHALYGWNLPAARRAVAAVRSTTWLGVPRPPSSRVARDCDGRTICCPILGTDKCVRAYRRRSDRLMRLPANQAELVENRLPLWFPAAVHFFHLQIENCRRPNNSPLQSSFVDSGSPSKRIESRSGFRLSRRLSFFAPCSVSPISIHWYFRNCPRHSRSRSSDLLRILAPHSQQRPQARVRTFGSRA